MLENLRRTKNIVGTKKDVGIYYYYLKSLFVLKNQTSVLKNYGQ